MVPFRSLYTFFSATVVLMAMTACAATSKQPLDVGEIAVDILSDSDVTITKAVARQSEDRILIDGKVRRKVAGGRGVIKGHIDVTLLNSEGQILNQAVAQCEPRIIPSRGTLTSSFSSQISLPAPKSSLVRLRFHNGPHND